MIFSRLERAFEVKKKTFLQVLLVFSSISDLKKTSENVADKTFKLKSMTDTVAADLKELNCFLKDLLNSCCQQEKRCNFSLVARYSFKFTRCKITRYSLQNSPVTCCGSCSLQKVTRYSLQKLLVAKNHLLLVMKFAFYSLLVAKIINHSLKQSQVHKVM